MVKMMSRVDDKDRFTPGTPGDDDPTGQQPGGTGGKFEVILSRASPPLGAPGVELQLLRTCVEHQVWRESPATKFALKRKR
jgi:hypothetical protein